MITRRNYLTEPAEQIDAAILARLSMLQTAMPGIVTAVDLEALTASVQPAIKERIEHEDGATEWVQLPVLLDCPIVFPHAGGASLSFPVKAGDEVLLIFASRCIDGWWANSGVNPPLEYRMHDLSDGFCVPGVWSQPRRIKGVPADCAELRSDDGEARVSLNPGSHLISLVTSGNLQATVTGEQMTAEVSGNASIKASRIVLDAPDVLCTGNFTAKGNVTDMNGKATMAGMRATYNGHTHNGGSSPDQQM